MILFEIGSAISDAASKIDIFDRTLAGMGGARLYVDVMTLLSALTVAAECPIYIAWTDIIWSFGDVLD